MLPFYPKVRQFRPLFPNNPSVRMFYELFSNSLFLKVNASKVQKYNCYFLPYKNPGTTKNVYYVLRDPYNDLTSF